MSEKTVTNNQIDLEKLNNDVLKLFKKDPLNTIVPAGFTGDDGDESDFLSVPDTCNIGVASFVPNLDDLETMAVATIGLVPYVGPLLQSFYTIIRNRTKAKVLDKDECEQLLNEKIQQLKKEMEELMDSKIEKSKAEMYKAQCNAAFDGIYNSSFSLLLEDLDILKLKLSKGIIEKPEGSFLTGLRGKFTIFRDNMLSLITVFRDPQILPHVYKQFVQVMYLYIFCMLNIINYWYQYGFDSSEARGTPAVDNVPECPSFRQYLSKNIGKSLKAMQNSLATNKEGLENLSKMLECDVLLYPVPLYKAPVVPSFNDMINVRKNNLTYSTPVVNIDVNMHARPFIYRIDGVNFIGDWATEDISGYPRRVPSEADQITGCIGFYIWSRPHINVKLSEPKYVTVRIFTKKTSQLHFDTGFDSRLVDTHDFESGSLIPSKEYSPVYEQLGRSDCTFQESPKTPTGFNISQKSSDKVKDFEISVKITSFDGNRFEKLLFAEVVVSDD